MDQRVEDPRIQTIAGIWVEPPFIRAIFRTLSECLEISPHLAEPECKRIAGDAGTGKTTLSQRFSLMYRPFTNESGQQYPVILLNAPVAKKSLALARALLKALGVPLKEGARPDIDDAIDQISTRIKILGVRAIVIDELQQLLEGRHNEINMMQTANVMKEVINRTGVPFFVFGMPYAERIFRLDPQLQSRFRSPLILPNYDFRSPEPRRLFLRFLDEVDSRLPFPSRSGLAELEKALPIYQSGSGNPRLTMTVIRKSALYAVFDEAERIEMGHLERAFESEMREATGPAFPNPFRTPPSPQSLVSPGSWVQVASIWERGK